MSPGLAVEKTLLSARALRSHSPSAHAWNALEVADVMSEAAGSSGAFAGTLEDADGNEETLLDLICFGNAEVGI